jgi:hypothetical protein
MDSKSTWTYDDSLRRSSSDDEQEVFMSDPSIDPLNAAYTGLARLEVIVESLAVHARAVVAETGMSSSEWVATIMLLASCKEVLDDEA